MSRDRNVVEKVVASLRTIGNFELAPLREAENGGCYKAIDAARRISVVIRTVWPHDTEHLQKLLAQARAAQAIEQSNIAKVIGSGELDEIFFMVSSFANGRTLRQCLSSPERLNTWELIDFARQACVGLESAHARGVVHHALHPDNIDLEFDGSTKILDLGLFRENDPSTEPFHANVAYLAPEQLAGAPVDRVANFYSIAVMLYEIATGTLPYSGETWEQLEANSQLEIPEPSKLNVAVPPGISAAIMKALARDRSSRFQGGPEFVRALEDYKSFGKPATPAPQPIATKVAPINVAAAVPARGSVATATELEIEPANSSQVISEKPSLVSLQEAAPWKPPVPQPAPAAAAEEPAVPAAPPVPSSREIAREVADRLVTDAMTATRKQIRRVDPWVAALSVFGLILVFFVGRTIKLSFQSAPRQETYETAGPAPAPETPAVAAASPAPVPEVSVADSAPAPVETPAASAPAAPAPQPRAGRRGTKAPAVVNVQPLPAGATSAAFGSVMVTTVPAGARVVVDGRAPAYTTPQLIPSLSAGVHVLSITKDGYSPASRPVQITAGARSNIAVQLGVPSGYLTVLSNPTTAYILIDGANTGHVTPSQVPVTPGTHTLTLRKLGYLDAGDTITLKSGEQQSRTVNLLESGSTPDIRVVQTDRMHKMFGNKVSGVKVTVRTIPAGATVLINGQTVGKATPVDFGLNPGNYVMEIQLAGYLSTSKTITVEAGKPLNFDETLHQ